MAKSRSEKKGGLGESVRTVIYAVLIALMVRTFLFEPFNIPSGSMEPTLLVGDYLFVSKYSYGYSDLSIFGGLLDFDGRILGSRPQRGDVAVFKLPTDDKTDYIKRLVGLPGDRIQVRQGVLYINDAPAPMRQIEDYTVVDALGRRRSVPQFIETIPLDASATGAMAAENPETRETVERLADDLATTGQRYALPGREHAVVHQLINGPFDNTPVFTVPEGHYFAMGDNRDNSEDSRSHRVGFIPEENLVGRAEFIWFSIGGGTRFWELWRWPTEIRYGRLFSGIE